MSKIKAMQKTIETNINKDFGLFETSRSFLKQKFNEIERAAIKTYSVSVYIDSNVEIIKKDLDGVEYKVKQFSKEKISKTIKALNKKTFEAFKAIDTNEASFKYVIIDTDQEEFFNLKRVSNTNIFYSVIAQDLLSYHMEDDEFNQIDTKEKVIQKMKELQEDENARFVEDKNGRYLVSFFMFVTKE